MWRVATLLHVADGLEHELSCCGDAGVAICQVLLRAVLDRPGPFGDTGIVGLEDLAQSAPGLRLHFSSILQIAVAFVSDELVVRCEVGAAAECTLPVYGV